jgi:hypothetical protein
VRERRGGRWSQVIRSWVFGGAAGAAPFAFRGMIAEAVRDHPVSLANYLRLHVLVDTNTGQVSQSALLLHR